MSEVNEKNPWGMTVEELIGFIEQFREVADERREECKDDYGKAHYEGRFDAFSMILEFIRKKEELVNE